MPTNIDTSPMHPPQMRCTHRSNALAVMVLVLSGWRIYNAVSLFPSTIPASTTLGGRLGGALQRHFTAVWLLVVNGLVYLAMDVASGQLARKLFPVTPAGARCDMVAMLKGRLSHVDPRHYNNVQWLAYPLITLDIMLLVLLSLVLWKSVRFATLRELLGGYEVARHIHFYAMAGAAVSMMVYLVMVALVPCTLLMMLGGRVAGIPSPIQGRSSYDI